MIIIIIKFIHYLAIVFSGGVLVGSGLIQSVYNNENKVPDITISKILKISPKIISVKATTNEKVGLIGSGKAIAAEAIVQIVNE